MQGENDIMRTFDQGTIIYGVRSEKYLDIPCRAIIITASCDVANCKVPKFYYIVAVDIQKWLLSDVGYTEVYKGKANGVKKNLINRLTKYSLDVNTLIQFDEGARQNTIQTYVENTKKQDDLLSEIISYRELCAEYSDLPTRRRVIENYSTEMVSFLKKVREGEIFHYYYLPQKAYMDGGLLSDGLIVDLQEIRDFPISDAESILSPGIDFLALPKNPKEVDRLKERYWLVKEDDFVMVEANIISPWREHLMQRFSFAFTRIGLDGPTDTDFKKLAEKMKGE